MKLQPEICPFPVLESWVKNTMSYTLVPWHIAGISRPLPVSRVLSEEQRKTGCNFILSVDYIKKSNQTREDRVHAFTHFSMVTGRNAAQRG